MRHVIVEGPDGAGKTQLARLLCSRHTLAYHHEGPPPATDVVGHYASLLVNASRPTVFDRFHLGELVYGPLLRGGSGLSPRDLTLLNRVIQGTGTAVVICLPPWETTMINSWGRQEFIPDESLRRVAYDSWTLLSRHQCAGRCVRVNDQVYDYTAEPAFELARYDRLPAGVVGSPTATVLFIGEQPNGPLDLPFFGPRNSSLFLHECLRDAGVSETDLALTNALTFFGEPRDLPDIISKIPLLKTVVPLGKVAERQLELQGIPPYVNVNPIPHPQWWKRFKSSDREGYVNLIREVHRAA